MSYLWINQQKGTTMGQQYSSDDTLKQVGIRSLDKIIGGVVVVIVGAAGILWGNDNRQTDILSKHTTELALIEQQQVIIQDRMKSYEASIKDVRDAIAQTERSGRQDAQELRTMIAALRDSILPINSTSAAMNQKLNEILSAKDIITQTKELKKGDQ